MTAHLQLLRLSGAGLLALRVYHFTFLMLHVTEGSGGVGDGKKTTKA